MTNEKTSLVLRCNNADMSSRNGFVWPGVGGIATAPDWVDDINCGHGLHGWLHGYGDYRCANYWSRDDAKWLVVEVAHSSILVLKDKCKFKTGKVVFVGTKSEAAKYIIEHEPQATPATVIGAVLECGNVGVLQGGALSVLTGGDYATMTGGRHAIMTGGDSSVMTGGDFSVMTGGRCAMMITGDSSMMTGGNRAIMTGGDYIKMTGGDSAKMTARAFAKMTGGDSAKMTAGAFAKMTAGAFAKMTGGDYATMTGGYYAIMTGGYYAAMTGCKGSAMHFKYHSGNRNYTVVAYVGENGILPGVTYKLDADHNVIEV